MNQRTILAVDTLGDRLVARIVRAPPQFQVADASMGLLNLDPDLLPDLQSDAAVLARGKAVRDALRENQGISGLLDHLSQTSPHEIRPLCVLLGPTDAERINWEMLCDQNDAFFALDQRWPIARIIDPINAPPRLRSEMVAPIRLLAVISALGIHDQQAEWERLREAVRYARDIGLHVKFRAMIGDADLLTKAESDIAQDQAAHLPGAHDVEVGPIETTPSRLTQSIRMWSPNILHVFCHGHANAGNQSLEFATANDHTQYAAGDPDTTAGSILVPAQHLATLGASLVNPWLLVLNCCSSGKADVGLQSMANQIVSRGFPAVVAMMEPVKAKDAYELTRAFYPQVFDLVKKASDELAQKTHTSLDWTPLMHQARCAISELGGRAAENSPEWSVPLLYLRGIEPHVFERGKGHTAAQLEEYRVIVETTAIFLRTAGQQLSEEQRIEAMEKALASVPREFWPSPDGNLGRDSEQP
jgi:hypothetical protein